MSHAVVERRLVGDAGAVRAARACRTLRATPAERSDRAATASLSFVPLVRPSHSTSRSSSSSSSLAPRSRMSTVTTRQRSGLNRASFTRSSVMARRAGPLDQRLRLRVREERRDLRRDVRARERLRRRAEPLDQPVEQQLALRRRERHVQPRAWLQMSVPPGSVQRVVRVVVDAVARRAVLEDHLPHRSLRRHDLRPRRPAASCAATGDTHRADQRCRATTQRTALVCTRCTTFRYTISSGCSRPVLVPILSFSIPYRCRMLSSMLDVRCVLSGNTRWRLPLNVPSMPPTRITGTFSCA